MLGLESMNLIEIFGILDSFWFMVVCEIRFFVLGF